MGLGLWGLFGLNMGIQAAMFVVSYLLYTERYYDLTGSCTFIALTLISYFQLDAPSQKQQKIS